MCCHTGGVSADAVVGDAGEDGAAAVKEVDRIANNNDHTLEHIKLLGFF